LTQTPGGLLTATAGVGALPLPVEASGNNNTGVSILTVGSQTRLPTFTIPPNLGTNSLPNPSVNGTPVQNATASNGQTLEFAVPSHIPPILPILVLGGAGILGLIISSIRK
jgi:hypothetical protein